MSRKNKNNFKHILVKLQNIKRKSANPTEKADYLKMKDHIFRLATD